MKNILFFHLIIHLYLMSLSKYTLCNSTCLSWKLLYMLITLNRALKVSYDWVRVYWNMPIFVYFGIPYKIKNLSWPISAAFTWEICGLLLTPAIRFQRSCRCLLGHYLIINKSAKTIQNAVFTTISLSWK